MLCPAPETGVPSTDAPKVAFGACDAPNAILGAFAAATEEAPVEPAVDPRLTSQGRQWQSGALPRPGRE
ncbi:Uncharacterised protein [Amycolatopsis camponoti]|uniref:Uncharacterized protein n=1 Tax=Amycolatopsis camponoti TaxID=2606593 RepID=A0A6I8LKR4_9PSEU|nr:Uncharacterised protein [Amycolatopsis camponoti]